MGEMLTREERDVILFGADDRYQRLGDSHDLADARIAELERAGAEVVKQITTAHVLKNFPQGCDCVACISARKFETLIGAKP